MKSLATFSSFGEAAFAPAMPVLSAPVPAMVRTFINAEDAVDGSGGSGSASTLNGPRAVPVEPARGKAFVPDDNHRVLRSGSHDTLSAAAAAELVLI